MPKLGTKTQSNAVKKQSPVVEGVPSTNLRSLPQVPVVKKEVVQPIETEKQLPKIRPQGVALPIEEPTSKDVETMASLLVSKPVVSEVTEAEVPPPPPLPKLGVLARAPSPAEVQSASDAVDELATAIKETTTINDEIGDTEQAITKLMLQKQTLEEASLQEAEKQNVLLSNLKTQQTEPVSRESFLESIRNPHALRNVSTQPKQEIVSQPETLLDTLKQSLADRRVAIAEEEAGEDVQELSSAVESATLLTPLKKTVDEVIIDNLAAIEAVQMKIAALKPTAELPLETGFTKQAQQQNRARSQAIKEIEKFNGEINVYHKNNVPLMAQKKTTQQEDIASKQQKVLSRLKTKQAEPQGESLLESIRKQTILKKTNNPPEETSGNTAKIQQKPGGMMKSLEQKVEEFKQKLPIASHHTHDEDDEWE
ncbi:MAG: hypothetical protein KA112_03530 [Alphaproteobacteria bacterium]|nr:hypothetical protein [Alphaproteobacteria bacterium]MBP7729668.1 hypothetical protein [Alphaproteobacteria bacterium]